jgi:hypothetical protein
MIISKMKEMEILINVPDLKKSGGVTTPLNKIWRQNSLFHLMF